jgi:hypothetical protein
LDWLLLINLIILPQNSKVFFLCFLYLFFKLFLKIFSWFLSITIIDVFFYLIFDIFYLFIHSLLVSFIFPLFIYFQFHFLILCFIIFISKNSNDPINSTKKLIICEETHIFQKIYINLLKFRCYNCILKLIILLFLIKSHRSCSKIPINWN